MTLNPKRLTAQLRITSQSIGLICGLSLIYGSTFWMAQPSLVFIGIFFAFALIWLSVVDLQSLMIPDHTIVIIAICGLAQLWSLPESLVPRLIEAVICLGAFTVLAMVFEHLLGRPALGFGDVKLLAASTLMIGPGNIIVAVFLAAVAGIAAFSILAASGRQKRNDPIPFGPFLAFSIWLCWLYDIWPLYLEGAM